MVTSRAQRAPSSLSPVPGGEGRAADDDGNRFTCSAAHNCHPEVLRRIQECRCIITTRSLGSLPLPLGMTWDAKALRVTASGPPCRSPLSPAPSPAYREEGGRGCRV